MPVATSRNAVRAFDVSPFFAESTAFGVHILPFRRLERRSGR
jgi:hypothetical protein